jgi:hypothetical protein
VAGGAGVGKSRLIAELASEADAQGALVLVGHCAGLGEGELPYAPVAGALRGMAATLEPPVLRGRPRARPLRAGLGLESGPRAAVGSDGES